MFSIIFIISSFLVSTYSLTYEECLHNVHVIHNGTHTSCGNLDTTTTYCLTNGTEIRGTCNFVIFFCSEQTLYHRPVHVIPNCHVSISHVYTTPLPLSPEQLRLFRAMIYGIDSRLERVRSKINSTDTFHIFSKQDHTNKIYIRNTDCWAYDLDLTSISPWNSEGHTRRAGVLLSPRHLIWARHYGIKTGSTFRFVDRAKNVIERKLIKSHNVPTPSSVHGRSYLHGYDMVIGLLDSDVPSTISYAKVLPKNFTTFYNSHTNLPVLSTDFEEKALVDDFGYMRDTMIGLKIPHSTLRLPYYERKIVGDSGNPSFFVIDNELVFLFVFTYGGAGAGTSVQYHHDNINEVMRQLGGGYQLTEINISKYMSNNQITQLFG